MPIQRAIPTHLVMMWLWSNYQKKVDFSDRIQPVILPKTVDPFEDQVIVTGWGEKANRYFSSGKYYFKLLKIVTNIVSKLIF